MPCQRETYKPLTGREGYALEGGGTAREGDGTGGTAREGDDTGGSAHEGDGTGGRADVADGSSGREHVRHCINAMSVAV